MTLPVSEPFFLLDESLSSGIVAEVSRVTGYAIATVLDEWSGRDFSINRLLDEEIISHLGEKFGHRAVWITCDWDARRKHRESINRNRISVLWLRGLGGRNPTPQEQTQMLCIVMDRVRFLIRESSIPVYLLVRLDANNDNQPFLQRLHGSILNRPPQWQRVPLG